MEATIADNGKGKRLLRSADRIDQDEAAAVKIGGSQKGDSFAVG